MCGEFCWYYLYIWQQCAILEDIRNYFQTLMILVGDAKSEKSNLPNKNSKNWEQKEFTNRSGWSNSRYSVKPTKSARLFYTQHTGKCFAGPVRILNATTIFLLLLENSGKHSSNICRKILIPLSVFDRESQKVTERLSR